LFCFFIIIIIIIIIVLLHIPKIEVASTSGEDDQSNRFLLTREIANLLHQTQQLYQVLDLTIEKASASASGAQQRAQQQEIGDTDSTEETVPLAREEVAKLLLLVSRAHGIGQLTDAQKHNLKMEVCLRKSYLRTILKQQDITQIMSALAAAGGGP
jgi:preprotein translocase subunit SecG